MRVSPVGPGCKKATRTVNIYAVLETVSSMLLTSYVAQMGMVVESY